MVIKFKCQNCYKDFNCPEELDKHSEMCKVDEDVVVLPGRVPQPEGSESGFKVSGQADRLDNFWSLEVQPLLPVQVVPADPDVVRNDPLQIFVC